MPVRVDPFARPWALHGVAASRSLESAASAHLPPHTLMRRAGLAAARLAVAIAPHAQRVWIAVGPGNNGGDGLEAAFHLRAAGLDVEVSMTGSEASLPADARASWTRAHTAGATFVAGPTTPPDLVIDALLGLGTSRAPQGAVAALLEAVNRHVGPRLAVDLPTGLSADTGACSGAVVRATHTLSLLTLKPGLFTAEGRACSGELWFDDLEVDSGNAAPDAWLIDASSVGRLRPERAHSAHKGRFGDVIVIGGAAGMGGALALAARAAVAAGAGRVFACPLEASAPAFDPAAPELMWRPSMWLETPSALDTATVVAGCGGGSAVREALPVVLSRSRRLVIDADALNAIAADSHLQALLTGRAHKNLASVLTPHPLEAARLLGEADARSVQADRVSAAGRLADRFACAVLLKGSGSVVAAPGCTPAINPTGNARLASAGTGDVLAGWLGGLWSANGDAAQPFAAACAAAFMHGAAAEQGDSSAPLPASALVERLLAGRFSAASGCAR